MTVPRHRHSNATAGSHEYRLTTADPQQIIPLPEAKDFQIQQRQKGAATTAARSGRSDVAAHMRLDLSWSTRQVAGSGYSRNGLLGDWVHLGNAVMGSPE